MGMSVHGALDENILPYRVECQGRLADSADHVFLSFLILFLPLITERGVTKSSGSIMDLFLSPFTYIFHTLCTLKLVVGACTFMIVRAYG